MSCVIQRLMIFSLGLTIHFFNPWATVFLFVELVKEVRKEILTHWMNVGWIWTRMPGDFTLGQHCSLLYYFISHGKKKKILFSLAIQSNSFPANPLTPTLPPPPRYFLCHFCVILTPEPAISFGNMAEWLSGPIMPLCLEILFA